MQQIAKLRRILALSVLGVPAVLILLTDISVTKPILILATLLAAVAVINGWVERSALANRPVTITHTAFVAARFVGPLLMLATVAALYAGNGQFQGFAVALAIYLSLASLS